MLSSPIFFKRLSRGLASRQMQNPPDTLGCEILGASLAPSRRVILAQVVFVLYIYFIKLN